MIKKVSLFALLLCFSFVYTFAQIVEPIKWKQSMKMTDDKSGVVSFTANIESGYHMYAMDIPADGPSPLSVNWQTLKGVKLVGKLTPSKAPHSEFDNMFEMKLSWWTQSVTLTQKFTATEPEFAIAGTINYAACNDQNCIPPSDFPFKFNGKAKVEDKKEEAEAVAAVEENKAGEDTAQTDALPVAATDSAATNTTSSVSADKYWQPVSADKISANNEASVSNHSLWYIFIAGFLGGLLALLTPCVWPMIPLNVSFFLKQNKTRSKAIHTAVIYGISIIVIYLLLGLLVTIIFGANKLNELSTNAVFNILFFLLLVVFAVSFFGAFEIKLPDSWANKMDQKAESTTGLLSVFFMAFTLSLVSFSCTGPIIGTLLVEAASMGNYVGPAVGMFGFALALAIPFTLFAIFPSWLKEMPRSGGWMNTVKVVLGFIELALSLKFLSIADLAYGWHILDREVFLSLWIVMFGLLGMYLLGKIRFEHDGEQEGIGVFRFSLALISLAFTVYLIPGLWGAPLKSVSAFVPPLYTQDFNLYGEANQEYDDFDEGMKAAQAAGKPVFIDFSGYGCVNCRKMEAAVLDETSVRNKISENFIVIKLMVDEKKALPQPITVNENGVERVLDTYGARWSYLQRYKFGANSQPYYAVLDANGELLSGPYFYDENISKFTDFLDAGIAAFKK